MLLGVISRPMYVEVTSFLAITSAEQFTLIVVTANESDDRGCESKEGQNP
jgi:hypothetical protein